MAAQTNGHFANPDPKEVGNAFITQYYPLLLTSPDHVHKFYQEGSEVSRPGPNGEMMTATTMQGINEMILSLNYEKYNADLTSVDAQASYKGGVTVLVTGVLRGEDGFQKMFTQNFFLAPQNAGYFVLNDIFRYVEGKSAAAPDALATNVDIAEVPEAPVTPEPELSEIAAVKAVPEEVVSYVKEAALPAENGKAPVAVTETVVEIPADSSTNDAPAPAAVVSPPSVQGDGSKKSFASIVASLKNNASPFQVRASPAKVVEKPRAPAVAPEAPVQAVPNGNTTAEKISGPVVKRHSIFVGNLPLDATPAQLEATFKKFGVIKRNGIQVRSSKGSCYGFVEFESEGSLKAALEESSILIGNRTAHIEEQKNEGDRVRGPQGRGGFRNENFRGRGNFNGGGRGYGRSDFDRKYEYSARNGGRSGGGPPFNREHQNGAVAKE